MTQIERFWTATPIWIQIVHKALSAIEEVPPLFYGVFCQISRSQGRNIDDLAPISAFLDDNSSWNSWMAMQLHI